MMSVRYQITVSDEADSYLQSMLAAGIYGRSIPEVVKRIVDAHLVHLFILTAAEKLRRVHQTGPSEG